MKNVEKIQIPKILFSLFKQNEINRHEYLLLCYFYLTKKLPNRKEAPELAGVSETSYVRCIEDVKNKIAELDMEFE